MSHPTIVEAAETLFVPLCIYNNTEGDHDHKVLKSFEEKAWNNPVVRIIDADRLPLAPRIVNQWTVEALAEGMCKALDASPIWLRLLASEARGHARGVETAIFGMS